MLVGVWGVVAGSWQFCMGASWFGTCVTDKRRCGWLCLHASVRPPYAVIRPSAFRVTQTRPSHTCPLPSLCPHFHFLSLTLTPSYSLPLPLISSHSFLLLPTGSLKDALDQGVFHKRMQDRGVEVRGAACGVVRVRVRGGWGSKVAKVRLSGLPL